MPKRLKPDDVAKHALNRGYRLGCPLCDSTVVTEPGGSNNGDRVVIAVCTNPSCKFEQRVAITGERPPRGRGVRGTIPKGRIQGEPYNRSPPSRPKCIVPGCKALVEENQLCETHLSVWRAAGSPEDVEAWAKDRHRTGRAKPRKTQARSIRVPVPSSDPAEPPTPPEPEEPDRIDDASTLNDEAKSFEDPQPEKTELDSPSTTEIPEHDGQPEVETPPQASAGTSLNLITPPTSPPGFASTIGGVHVEVRLPGVVGRFEVQLLRRIHKAIDDYADELESAHVQVG